MAAHDLWQSMHLECFHEAVSSRDEYSYTQLLRSATYTAKFYMTNRLKSSCITIVDLQAECVNLDSLAVKKYYYHEYIQTVNVPISSVYRL